MNRGAHLSEDGIHRYSLFRKWGNHGKGTALFIMLNPSTADWEVDDPTIRRCIKFAQRENFHSLDVINLFSYRATKPNDLDYTRLNDDTSLTITREKIRQTKIFDKIICAWGASSSKFDSKIKRARDLQIWWIKQTAIEHNKKLFCLGLTKNNDPRHPLYLKSDSPLIPFSRET
jgi:hypothetical protein